MYFDDITNEELQYYHGLKVPNFTIKLSDVLHKTNNAFDNKLFKIEEITTDKLYRIYPLFNTGRITSSNPNDKIIDDKVILAEKTTGTTYLTFISDETQEIQDYSSYGTYYSIGDTLTTAQYNSIVSLIRQFGGITRNLTYDQNTITGTYGKYDFSIKTGFTDKGILINNNHLTTETDFHIKLSNAVFNHSTYTVKMTALRLSEINIMGEDESDEEPETIPIEAELTNGEYVHIPTTDLEAGDILLYDMTVEIKHDKPIINGSWITSILLNVSPLIIQVDDTATLTATATDNNGEPFANKTISFLKGQLFFEKDNEITYTTTSDRVEDSLATFPINNDFILEFDLKNTEGNGGLNIGATTEYNPPSSANYRLFIGTDEGKFSFNNRTTSSSNTKTGTFTPGTYYHMKLIKNGNFVSAYYDDTLIDTKSVSWVGDYSSFELYFIGWGTSASTIKNVVLNSIDGTAIDTATTDSNGVATTSYTGEGAGPMGIIAKCDNLPSERIILWDTLWYDMMTSDVGKWTSNNASLTASYSTNGTTLTNATTTSYNYTSSYTATDNTIIEFDIQAISTDIGQVRFVYKGADRYMKTSLTDGSEHHMKFICNNGSVTWLVDGVETGNAQTTTTSTVMRFVVNNATVRIKDLKAYSL